MWEYTNTEDLYHHGIQGQKWGVRRYQNVDGSLTPAGKKRQKVLKTQLTKESNRIYKDLEKDGKRKYNSNKLGYNITRDKFGKDHEYTKIMLDAVMASEADLKNYKNIGKAVSERFRNMNLRELEKELNIYTKDSDSFGKYYANGRQAVRVLGQKKFNSIIKETGEGEYSKYVPER